MRGEIWFKSRMFYNGYPISVENDYIRIGDKEMLLSDNYVEGYDQGIIVDTKVPEVHVGR